MHHLKFELEEPVTLCPQTWNELELLGYWELCHFLTTLTFVYIAFYMPLNKCLLFRWQLVEFATFPGLFYLSPGQLSLLPSVGQEMNTSQNAVMLCCWGVKAGVAYSTADKTCGWQVKLVQSIVNTCHT